MNKEKEKKQKITKRRDDFSKWYLDVIVAADLADYTPVRGCMVIKPNGYAIWENIQNILGGIIKETGHRNAYFPIFIPKNFLEREADHVEGFSPELAVVTYAGGKKLKEELVVRPTSETIIYDSYSKWVKSWRDLPILINQWCNVVRWELRTKPFIRTTEFLWQEGHTAHTTHKEAEKKVLQMLKIYVKFTKEYLAIPAILGTKSESEKFAGGLKTLTFEPMMQDKKALQCGTSHDLGQNFSKVFDIKFMDKDKKEKYVWQTCWGMSTRLIGAIVMTHGDDRGIIVPPKIASLHLVFVPIWKNREEKKKTNEEAKILSQKLSREVVSHIDKRDLQPGWRYTEWERQGVPIRIEIGPNDIRKKQVIAVRRDNGQRIVIPRNKFPEKIDEILKKIQSNLLSRTKKFQKENTYTVKKWSDFKKIMESKRGFIYTDWCNSAKCEEGIKKETKATIRCIPFGNEKSKGKCIYCNKPAKSRPLFAQAY